jgi:hypothetical protein
MPRNQTIVGFLKLYEKQQSLRKQRYRMMRKIKMPSNRYTPFDDITIGNKIEVKRDGPIQDNKQNKEYEKKNKTV